MLTIIKLTNFKSIAQVELDLAKINVFIGPNRAGKSSIFQSLLLLKQTLNSNSGISWNGDIVDMGTFENVVNVGAEKKFISIGLGGYFHLTDLAEELRISQVNFKVDINIDQEGLNQVNHSINTGTATISGNTSRSSPDSTPIEYRFNGYQTSIMHRLSVWHTLTVTWGPANLSQVKIDQIRGGVVLLKSN